MPENKTRKTHTIAIRVCLFPDINIKTLYNDIHIIRLKPIAGMNKYLLTNTGVKNIKGNIEKTTKINEKNTENQVVLKNRVRDDFSWLIVENCLCLISITIAKIISIRMAR